MNLEEALKQLTMSTLSLNAKTEAYMDETKTNFKNKAMSIHNLEVQVGQIAKPALYKNARIVTEQHREESEGASIHNHIDEWKALAPGTETFC